MNIFNLLLVASGLKNVTLYFLFLADKIVSWPSLSLSTSLVRVRDTECENGIMMMEEEGEEKMERRDFGGPWS